MNVVKNRFWRPQAQLTATVRLTDLAAKNLNAWLSVQVTPPRSANEALNMALESLAAEPVEEGVLALRAAYHRSLGELSDLETRLRAIDAELTIIEKNSQARPRGLAKERRVRRA